MAELERVIGKKLFESTWSDYAHPYLIQTFLISVLIAVILEAYLTKKYISKNEVGKRFVLMAMCMGVVIGGIYLSQYIPRFGPTTKSGYIRYLKERTHGVSAEVARQLWVAHEDKDTYIDPYK